MEIDAIDNDFSLTDDQCIFIKSLLGLVTASLSWCAKKAHLCISIDARNVLCYRKDEGGPLRFALQEVILNHP